MSNDLPEIDVMSVAESAWAMWSHASDVDTHGRCNCGHEGLGAAWHTHDCRGANAALQDKVIALLEELHDEWRSGHENSCGGIDDDGTCPYAKLPGGKCHYPMPPSLRF